MSAVADAYFPPPAERVITAAVELYHAGWHPIPIEWKKKIPAIGGVTGYEGRDLDEQGIHMTFREVNHAQLGARLPVGVIGIDVDQYDQKRGWDTIEEFRVVNNLPPLPPTAMSTSRPWPSGIRLYLVAEGIKFKGAPLPGVELIQRHHRFIMCAPSVHPKTGEAYRWVSGHGEVLDGPPRLLEGQIATLPWSWVERFRDDREESGGRPAAKWSNDDGRDDMEPAVASVVERAMSAEETGESRHDAMHRAACLLWRMDEQGRRGTQTAFDTLQEWFIDTVAPDRGSGSQGRKIALGEFNRSLRDGLDFIRTHQPRMAPGAQDMLDVLGNSGVEMQATKAEVVEPSIEDGESDWLDPEPIDKLDATEFPLQVLPAWMQVVCEDLARSIQTPIDLPAMCALGVLSVLGTRRVEVEVEAVYTETANLYLAVGMPPSSGKSPVFNRIFAPVREFQKELRLKARQEIAEWEAKRKLAEKSLKEAEKNGNLMDLTVSQLALNDLVDNEPWPPQLLADDQTPEAFVDLLHRHGRIAIVSTEGDLFSMMDRYSDNKAAQLGPYLKAWSGDAIDVNRVSKKDPKIIENALASVCLTVQPGVLAELGQRVDFSVRGLPQRFMYSLPESLAGKRRHVDRPAADPRVYAVWNDRITELGKQLGSGVHRVQLTPEATRMFNEWKQHLEARRGPRGDLKALSEWSTKCESSVARLAGLLWLADGAEGRLITPETMRRAITVGRYWIDHAKLVLGLWEPSVENADASTALHLIEKNRWETVTARQLMRGSHRFTDREVAADAMAFLEDRGWVRRTRHPTRPSVAAWRPHPCLVATTEPSDGDATESWSEAMKGEVSDMSVKSPKDRSDTPPPPFPQDREGPGDTGGTPPPEMTDTSTFVPETPPEPFDDPWTFES